MSKVDYEYQVALSFAGEDRKPAEALARILKYAEVSVFYDLFEKDTLWGKDLFQHLADIYKNRARYCVVFVSKHYRAKKWTAHELHNAQARLFQEKSEYILPIRVDDAELPGLSETIGYLDLKKDGINTIAVTLLKKLGLEYPDEMDIEEANWDGAMTTYQGEKMTSYWPAKIDRAQEETMYEVKAILPRIPWGNEAHNKRQQVRACNDCGVLPGQYHVPSCDMEYCPSCSLQVIGCDCDLTPTEPLWSGEDAAGE